MGSPPKRSRLMDCLLRRPVDSVVSPLPLAHAHDDAAASVVSPLPLARAPRNLPAPSVNSILVSISLQAIWIIHVA
jgi:hypothetical protein